MDDVMMKKHRTALAMIVVLTVLSSGLCVVMALGQSGNARSNNSTKKAPAAKTTSSSRRRSTARKTSKKKSRATTQTNNSIRRVEPKPDADEQAWERIKTSSALEDFKMYLLTYPKGHHADQARTRLQELDDAARNAEAKRRAPGPETNKMGMQLVYVPPGDFMMGGMDGENERPAHPVKITEGFYMGRYEVTQSQWFDITGRNPSYFKNQKQSDDRPVEQVSWDDVQSFLKILNQRQDGFSYRLPTEAEWEYACRARKMDDHGTELMFWGGGSSDNQTHPVGTRQPNAFGLYDMLGNVWEWCQDVYHADYDGAPNDGSEWLSKSDHNTRVLRGGSWASHISSHERKESPPDKSTHDIGFRVVAVRTK